MDREVSYLETMATAKIRLLWRLLFVVCACTFAVVFNTQVAHAYTSSKVDVSWYKGHESASTYTISTPPQLAGLAQLVNGTYSGIGAVGFSGKTIRVTSDIQGIPEFIRDGGGAFEPIGTSAHPFQGTITGWNSSTNAAVARNVKFNLSVTDSKAASNLGLFGYVGDKGSINYLSVSSGSSVSVNVSAANTVVQGVGGLVGTCMGKIDHCASAAVVTVTNNAALSASAHNAIRNVGGLAGTCKGNLANSTNSGAVTIKSSSSTYVDDNSSYPVAEHIGGVVGCLGDDASPYSHGTISGCSNTGQVDLTFTGEARWSERFSEYIFPAAEAVGGVAGYSYGNIENSNNSGAIKAAKEISTSLNMGRKTYTGGDCTGGIVGSLRGVTASGAAEEKDAGKEGAELAIAGCANTGQVDGYHAVGGIAGVAGTYTTITRAHNSGKVNSYRWNKPAGAGIAGQAYGNVSFCYNTGDVENIPGAGYYCAGIVGMLFRYWDPGLVPTSPESSVYSCYNAGHIYVTAGNGNWKQGGIVGQNDGYVHDNVLLRGTCYDNRFGSDTGNDYGTWGSNTLVDDSELKSNTTIRALNAMCDSKGWDAYFTLVDASSKNAGRPILNTEASGLGASGDLSTGTVVASCTKNASYTGLESVPEIAVTYNGKALTQNVDYKIVPQSGATAYTGNNQPYHATVVGIGAYKGTASSKVAYGISTGDLATCTVAVAGKKFNWSNQPPTKDMITVNDAAGNPVDPANWQFSAQGDENGRFINYKNGGYTVTITPAAGSNLYTGSVTGTYTISKADIRSDCTTYGFEYKGEVFYWDDKAEDWVDGKRPSFVYTGGSIRPYITGVSYLNQGLLEGRDYKAIYGNPNSDSSADDAANANTEVTSADGTNRGCVTVRYITYSDYKVYNFTNFTNLLFDIVPAGTLPSFIAYEQARTGSPIEPFAGTYLGLYEGVDYTVSYSNNVEVGTASYTINGIGAYAGSSQSGTFKIMNAGDVPNRAGSATHVTDVSGASVEISNTSANYTGSAIDPNVTVKVNGTELTRGADYALNFNGAELVNAGDYPFTVVFGGDYKGTARGTFAIHNVPVGSHGMFRLYNPNSGEHFYTADQEEHDYLVSLGWNDEGWGWTAPDTSNTPVYRLYNANGGEHHYTMDAGERDMLVGAGWSDEGIGWYSDDKMTVPLYREYNPNAFANNHNYTTNREEHDYLVSIGWQDEGTAWYGV